LATSLITLSRNSSNGTEYGQWWQSAIPRVTIPAELQTIDATINLEIGGNFNSRNTRIPRRQRLDFFIRIYSPRYTPLDANFAPQLIPKMETLKSRYFIPEQVICKALGEYVKPIGFRNRTGYNFWWEGGPFWELTGGMN
jgi:hypothetical protein